MPTRYTAYGLTLCSAEPLPGLPSEDMPGRPTVRLRPGPVAMPPPDAFVGGRFGAWSAGRATVAWAGYAGLCVERGRCVRYAAQALARASPAWLRGLLLGAGLGLLLHQRGTLVLHASAVVLEGGAVAVAGPKGAGKSTLCAALARRGYPLLADDVVAVTDRGGAPYVEPGVPQVRLWAEAARAVAPEASGTRLHAGLDKFVFPVPPATGAPLRAVFVLEGAASPRARPAGAPWEALRLLLPHLYAPRFVGARCLDERHLAGAARLGEDVPVFRLGRSPGLAGLPALADLVVRTAADVPVQQGAAGTGEAGARR